MVPTVGDKLKGLAKKAASAAISLNRPNYFKPPKEEKTHSDLAQVKADLASELPALKREAMKRIIAWMTMGTRDVSFLFTDVANCMQTHDIELKKLVYLYLINFAKTQPELVILIVNSFLKDCEDKNPLIRALAIRTMGCIRLIKLVDYIAPPLHSLAKDKDAYVRKTVALCIAKVHELSPEALDQHGFLDLLYMLAEDKNSVVLTSALTSLYDIQQRSEGRHLLASKRLSVQRILRALPDCGEWAQAILLDCIGDVPIELASDVQLLIDQAAPRLQHANLAVVIAACRVLLKHIAFMTAQQLGYVKHKIEVGLLAFLQEQLTHRQYEIAFCLLKQINLLYKASKEAGEKVPFFSQQDPRLFYSSLPDEPSYVKMEKLQMLLVLIGSLTDLTQVQETLDELGFYAMQQEADFSRSSIRGITSFGLSIKDKTNPILPRIGQTLINCLSSYAPLHVMEEACIAIELLSAPFPDYFIHAVPILITNAALSSGLSERTKLAQLWLLARYAPILDPATLDSALRSKTLEALDNSSEFIRQTIVDVVFLVSAGTNHSVALETLNKIIHESDKNELVVGKARLLLGALNTGSTKLIGQLVQCIEKQHREDNGSKINVNSPSLLKIEDLGTVASIIGHHPPELVTRHPNSVNPVSTIPDLLDLDWDEDAKQAAEEDYEAEDLIETDDKRARKKSVRIPGSLQDSDTEIEIEDEDPEHSFHENTSSTLSGSNRLPSPDYFTTSSTKRDPFEDLLKGEEGFF